MHREKVQLPTEASQDHYLGPERNLPQSEAPRMPDLPSQRERQQRKRASLPAAVKHGQRLSSLCRREAAVQLSVRERGLRQPVPSDGVHGHGRDRLGAVQVRGGGEVLQKHADPEAEEGSLQNREAGVRLLADGRQQHSDKDVRRIYIRGVPCAF